MVGAGRKALGRPRETCVDYGCYRASSEHPTIRPSDHLSPTQSLLLLLLLPRWQVPYRRHSRRLALTRKEKNWLRGPQMGGGSERPRRTCVDGGGYRASSEHPSIRTSEHLSPTQSLLLCVASCCPGGKPAPWTKDARMVGCSDGQMVLRTRRQCGSPSASPQSFIPSVRAREFPAQRWPVRDSA